MNNVALATLAALTFALTTTQTLAEDKFSVYPGDPIALKKAIAEDLDSLFGDTVDEGEIDADVNEKDGVPAMECTIKKGKKHPGQYIAICNIEVKVVGPYAGDISTGYAQCSNMVYTFMGTDIKNLELRGGWDDCASSVNDSEIFG